MEGRDLFINISRYIYILLVLGFAIIFMFNFGDYKEDSLFCAGYYDGSFINNEQVSLMYWMENNLCCHFTLNKLNEIIQECQI